MNFNISKKIFLSFFILILLFVINALSCFFTLRHSAVVIKTAAEVVDPSLYYLENYNLMVTQTKMLTTNWVFLRSKEEDKAALIKLIAVDYPALKSKILPLSDQWDKKMNDSMQVVFKSFDVLLADAKIIMAQLERFEDYDDPLLKLTSESDIEDEILPRTQALISKLDNIRKYITEEKKKSQEQLLSSSMFLITFVSSLAVLFAVIATLFSIYMSRIITRPLLKVRDVINRLGKGELPEMGKSTRTDEIGEMENSVENLSVKLRYTSEFANEIGNWNFNVHFEPLSKMDTLGHALIDMRNNLKRLADEDKARSWINAGLTQIADILRADQDDLKNLYTHCINFLVLYTNACTGGLFKLEGEENIQYLELKASHAYDASGRKKEIFKLGEGLIGQAAVEKKTLILDNLSGHYTTLPTLSGEIKPNQVLIAPLVFEGTLKGVLELASISGFSSAEKEFLDLVTGRIAGVFAMISRKKHTEQLLVESQELNEKLHVQEEELRQHQLELMQRNNEMEEKAKLLAAQNEDIRQKNEQLIITREAIKLKADQLEASNKYKSEFMANMSHELRTPLNSIMVLSNILCDNDDDNLTEKQLEFATIISKSGGDLLSLINDILDLSKIEAGKLDLEIEEVDFKDIKHDMDSLFKEHAVQKNIDFGIIIHDDVPENMRADQGRIGQVLKNLLSNAFKFTPVGGKIELSIFKAGTSIDFKSKYLRESGCNICFAVKDNGIGIPSEKHTLIFEAFKQADGSTSRNYGGTGLGLSICNELSSLLGGEISLESAAGMGSTFTLVLPRYFQNEKNDTDTLSNGADDDKTTEAETSIKPISRVDDTKPEVATKVDNSARQKQPAKGIVLIIEDDGNFAGILTGKAEENGFLGVVAGNGTYGLELARNLQPSAIILDIGLPDINGWVVMEELKKNEATANVPVHIISGRDNKNKALQKGAITFLQKPVPNFHLNEIFAGIHVSGAHMARRVLMVDHDKDQGGEIRGLLSELNICYESVTATKEEFEKIGLIPYNVIIIIPGLHDGDLISCIRQIKENELWASVPIIVYSPPLLELSDRKELDKYSSSVIEQSPDASEQLMAEVTLFFEKVEMDKHRKMYSSYEGALPEDILEGKKVLIVDDDPRNIFLMSYILNRQKLEITVAGDGLEAIAELKKRDDIDIVLMDIMMPNMNGYEAMVEIRKMEQYKNLPVIALTASAMVGDRQKCVDAGASDYITKPVDKNKMLAMMRVWLSA